MVRENRDQVNELFHSIHSLSHVRLRTATKLAYRDAQNVIEGKPLGDVPVIPEHDAQDISHDIKTLADLAQQLRRERLRNGALKLDSLRLQFKLDENGLPLDCGEYEICDANLLVEEVSMRGAFIDWVPDASDSSCF